MTILNTNSSNSLRCIYMADDGTHSASLTYDAATKFGSAGGSTTEISDSNVTVDSRTANNSKVTINGKSYSSAQSTGE